MTPNRSRTADSTDRVGGRSPQLFRIGLALACLTLVGLTQTGCQSSGCNSCGGFGSRLTNGVQSLNARLFSGIGHRNQPGCSTCGTLGSEEGTIVESGVPITPGSITVPPPGTIVPPPAVESAPTQLEPLNTGATSPTSSKASQAGASRSAYEANASRNVAIASKRGSDLSRAYRPPSPPTQAAYLPEEPDILDHLPPVDLPADLSRKVAPMEKGADPAGNGAPPAIIVPSTLPTTTSSTEPDSAGDSLVLPSAPPANAPTRSAPGMARSASVAPLLAGGSLPSAEGLAWLKEKGYRTLVDLRPRTEVESTFPDQVSDNGMIYVAIPFGLDPINPTRLARFNDLIAQADQRPLYFCDADGRRAGLIWYMRLRSRDHEDPAAARAKTEELGLIPGDVAAAETFLKLNVTINTLPIVPLTIIHAPDRVEPVAPPVAVAIAATPPLPAAPAESVQFPATSRPVEAALIDRPHPAATFDPFGRPASWKPVTALVLSGLGVPLAYWSGSSLFQKRAPRRASLTARKPGPRKALPSSDA